MTRRVLLPALAVIGAALAGAAAWYDARPAEAPPPAVPHAAAPFSSSVAGSGIVEPAGEAVAVGTPVPGIVAALYAGWGQEVKQGDPLFRIDDADLRAQALPAAAAIREAEARLDRSRALLAIARRVTDRRALSEEELQNRLHAAAVDAAALVTARAELKRIEMEMERRTVRAPTAGRVLAITIHPGEYAASGAAPAPVLLGKDDRLWVRADIDEYDAGRVSPNAAAVAVLRGDPGRRVPLRLVRIDPVVVPKVSLTGIAAERTDTRVLQLVYSFDPKMLPGVHIGRQMDVFIAAAPAGAGR